MGYSIVVKTNLSVVKKLCSVCREDVLVDQFGNGRCDNCSWEQAGDALDYPNRVRYPNRVSYIKALELFAQGKALVPSLNDFVEGLFFYSEMEFDYKLRRFGAFLITDDLLIEFSESGENAQYFKTKEDFINKARIDGKLLKDIWSEVKNADYMSCLDTPPSDEEKG